MDIKKILESMTLEEKIAFCSGSDFWHTKSFNQYDIPAIMMCDGPHGLRKQESKADHLGVNKSKPATCFPTASALACSWDPSLVYEVGQAIAKEARKESVSLVLGPGINIKRNPLCGRNFEYFSEDPYLTGELATAFVKAVEGEEVGSSLKHFAANSQEHRRFISNSIVDERALHEIYLSAFEKVVKDGNPSSVMCAYNKLNGIKMSDHIELNRSILREKWGFKGLIITDWGAMNNRVEAFKAGVDLEMPGGIPYFDAEAITAVKNGTLSEKLVDESVMRILTFLENKQSVLATEVDMNSHHELAVMAAVSSAVLLKNEACLPIGPEKRIAVIGKMAEKMRLQGAGSSYVNPTRWESFIDILNIKGIDYQYTEGYDENGHTTEELLNEATRLSSESDLAVVCIGLPEAFESEGFDRSHMSLPEGHNRLIDEIAKVNSNTIVIIFSGSIVEMPWADRVTGILNMYLPGQGAGEALYRLIYGEVNPSGKLAESYPIIYADVPSAECYGGDGRLAEYRESIYVGYRYYDKAAVNVRFPFGHGLSYTTFEYNKMAIETNTNEVIVHVSITNTGNVYGSEVVQLYLEDLNDGVHKPIRELKGFKKVSLNAGETQQIQLNLKREHFRFFDVIRKDFSVQKGQYRISLGSSSRDLRLSAELQIEEGILPLAADDNWYKHPTGYPSKADFVSILGKSIEMPEINQSGKFTMDDAIADMQASFVMRQVYKVIRKSIGKQYGGEDDTNPHFKMSVSSSTEVPLKNLVGLSMGMFPEKVARGLLDMANKRYLKGLIRILRG